MVLPFKWNVFSSTFTAGYYLFKYVVLTFECVDEILWCYHSNETSSAVLSHDTIYLVCRSNFCVCGWNPMVWPFKPLEQYFHLVLLNHILTSSTFPAKGFNSPAGFSGLTSTCGGYPPSVVSVNLVFKDGLVHSKQSWPSFSHHSTALQLGFDLRHKAMQASDDFTESAKGVDKPFVLEHQYGV